MDAPFTPGNLGVNVDQNASKIYFFDRDTITVAICWPKPAAWQKTKAGWRQLRLSDTFFQMHSPDLAREIWLLEHVADRDGQLQFPFMMARGTGMS